MLKMWEKIGGDEVIAQLVERDQIPNFLKEAVVGPNEAMIYIRNGKIEDVLTQDKVKVESQGITGWFKSKMGGGDLIQILFVSTSVVELNTQIGKTAWKLDPAGKIQKDKNGEPDWEVQGILSKDNEEIKGTCTIRVQINQNNVKQIFNLMRSAEGMVAEKTEAKSSWIGRNILGRTMESKPTMVAGKFLFKSDLEEKINNELLVKVLYPQLSGIEAKDLKGNMELIREMETTAEVELRKTLELWGMNLIQFFTVFDRTASDALAAHKKKQMQIFEQAEFDKDIDVKSAINDRNREYEIDKNEIEKKWALTFGDQAGEDRLAWMQLEAAVERDKKARLHEVEMKGKEFDEDIRQKKMDGMTDVELKKADGMTDVDLKRADMLVDEESEDRDWARAKEMFAQGNEAERQKLDMTQKHSQDMKKMDVDTQQMGVMTANQQIMTLQQQIADLDMKIADAPVEKQAYLQNMINQKTLQLQSLQQEATKRQLGTTGGPDAAVAFMNAEAQKYNMDTYKSAEDRERQHQVNMTNQASQMMNASKQNVPQYVGGGYVPPQQPAVNVVNVQGQASPQPQQGNTCPACGENVKPTWKSCPGCGGALGQKSSSNCPGCGEAVKPAWKICPGCQYPLQKKSNTCPGCGDEVKPNWKSCPGCGQAL